ncbi:MAG: hypothetical protein JO208_10265 [Alphaproteobacteria bacterium]|nr:hypothetical protein [Alphaproteobacteria bacterium]
MANLKQTSSEKEPGRAGQAVDREDGLRESSKSSAHKAPLNDGRHGNKHAGHDLDSGQHSTSGSRSR